MAQAVTLPLATVSVKEARQLNLCYAFQVISPVQTLTLQAATQEEMELWISTIQNATASLLGCTQRTRMSMKDMEDTVLGRVRLADGNKRCADCGDTNPSWASINLGALICLSCAGVHRQMGVHVSKVRSLELDTEEP